VVRPDLHPDGSWRRGLLGALGATLLLALAATGAHADGLHPTREDREVLFKSEARRLLPLPPTPVVLAEQDDVDVVDYDLTLVLDPATSQLEGACRVTFTVASGVASVSELVLDLYSGGLTVDGVDALRPTSGPLTFTHGGDVLRVTLLAPLGAGDGQAEVVVRYRGTPGPMAFGGPMFRVRDGVPLVATLSESKLARNWWPCKDRPDDKATVTMRVEAPAELRVASNGEHGGPPTPSPTRPGFAMTTWREAYPISTYLVSLALTDYVSWAESYRSVDGLRDMQVVYYAYPEREAAAREDWNITVPVLEYFSRVFYEYPFLEEKYGHAMFEFSGAMEHQTMTSYGSALVTGDHRYDFVVVHEAAHQWWGDHVGPASWQSLWLNEGFATYCQALWVEAQAGRGEYLQEMRELDYFRSCGGDFTGTVHAPVDDDQDGWPDGRASWTVYNKGAWVLHMLRWVLGQPSADPVPEVIFDVLRRHGRAHPYAAASTDDFQRTAEETFPGGLAWFFDQWVHRTGRPRYEVGWSAAPQPGGSSVVHLRVRQTQGETFRMPVLVRVSFTDGTSLDWGPVWNETPLADYQIPVNRPVSRVDWDPDGWILKCVTGVEIDFDGDGWPDFLDGCPEVPNPEQEDLDGVGGQDACQVGIDYDADGSLNEADCAPADALAWTAPPDTILLRVRKRPTGEIDLAFSNLPDAAGQRAPATDVDIGQLARLRSLRSVAATSLCLARAVDAPEMRDPSTIVAGGTYFLAYPWNGCAALRGPDDPPGAPGPLSACR
jgi:hypothetical protein